MPGFIEKIKKGLDSILDIGNEEKNLLKFTSSIKLSQGQIVLDIGCGYGKNMMLLRANGFEVIGIDENPDIVKTNLEAGLNCLTLQEFDKTRNTFDVMLMSHIIEHFQPCDLFKFLDDHLDRLKPGGHIIITTPLNSSYFYHDFDHVKPYHPIGIGMVFGTGLSQIRFSARNRINLVDLWFRKSPYRLSFYPGLYLGKYSRIPIIINLIYAILFRTSFGLIGRKDGWMGLYRKENEVSDKP
jgi:SAM-dependent methyltransferase